MKIELVAYKIKKTEVYRGVYETKYDDWHDAGEQIVKEMKAKGINFDSIGVEGWIFDDSEEKVKKRNAI